MKSSKPAKFLLQGGFGNQLFILAAAEAFQKETNREVIFETGHLKYGHPPRKIQIEEFTDIKFKSSGLFIVFLERVIIRAARFSRTFEMITKFHISRNPGFDEFLFSSKRKQFFVGYFQTWKYSDLVAIKKRLLANEKLIDSNNFANLKHEVETIAPIMVHIRRNDYINMSDSYGLLDSNYFNKNINKIRIISGTNAPVWIITDGVADELSNIKYDFILDNSCQFTNFQLMVLISASNKIIMSNSSFSWWAAFLSNANSYVIAPEPWYRNLDLPIDLLPEYWIKSKVRWS